MTFLDKLVALLSKGKLPPQYNIVPFLSVHDPEADVKSKAQAYVSFALRAMPKGKPCNAYRKRPTLIVILSGARLARFESTFIRLLHLMAHHPDFRIEHEFLPDIAK